MRTRHPLKTSLLAGILALGIGGCDSSSGGAGTRGSGGSGGALTGESASGGGSGASSHSGGASTAGASSGAAGAPSSSAGNGGGGSSGRGGASTSGGSSLGGQVKGGNSGTTTLSMGGNQGSGGGVDSSTASKTGGNAGGSSGGRGGSRTSEGGQTGSGGDSASGGGTSTTSTGGASMSAGCGASEGLKSGRATIDVSGSEREYILKMPAGYDGTRPYMLIFGFHARGGNATQVAGSGNDNYYGLAARAGDKAIFVAPEGLDAGWRNSDGRDITFVRAMLAFFNSKLCIDQQRIFSTGFSFGGMMSDAIGCAMADVFRAIAPMAGGLPTSEHPYSGCDQVNDHPIAAWISHGDNDTTVALADGKAARDLFVKRNKCQSQTSSVTPSPCVAYQGCLEGYPVHWCQFSGGHGVPDFASKAIWDFFSQF